MIDERPTIRFSGGDAQVLFTLHADEPWTYWDITTTLMADAGPFHGEVRTILDLSDLSTLQQRLMDLDQHVGQLHQSQWQPNNIVSLTFDLLQTGHLRVAVVLEDWTSDVRFAFTISADQTYLPAWIADVVHALKRFP